MSRRILSGLSVFTLLLAACSTDTIGPREFESPSDVGPPLPVSGDAGDPGDALVIENDLTIIMAEIVPNDNSTLGKFKNIQNLYNAGDIQGAVQETGNLISFITTKYDQYLDPPKPGKEDECLEYNGNSDDLVCAPKPYNGGAWTEGNDIYVDQLFERVKVELWAWVGLSGNVCEIPGGNPGTFCQIQTQNEEGFVYFPPDLFSQLTFVSIESNPEGLNSLQNVFDEYPTYLRVLTAPITDFSGAAVKPLVVICFNDQVLLNPVSLLARLLLGTDHEGTFQLLPKPNYNSYPPEALAQAESLCGEAPSESALGFSNRTVLGRLANKVLKAVLPRTIQAQYSRTELAFGGVGGSAEEFSDFSAIDPGLKFGGVGGSAEEFLPPALAPRAQAVPGAQARPGEGALSGAGAQALPPPPAGAIVGTAGPSDNSSGAPWATVSVTTDLGTPIAGAEVTFTLNDPTTAPYDANPSQAAFCGGVGSVTVTTGADGEASLACINFGTLIGYKNLKATVDPATVSGLACVIISNGDDAGLCAADPSTVSQNWLVATVSAAAATLEANSTTNQSATVNTAVADPPSVLVKDAFGNPVGGVAVTFDVTGGGGTVVPAGPTTVTTDDDGVATATSWTLGTAAGTDNNTVTATAAGLGGSSVTFTASGLAGAAASIEANSTTNQNGTVNTAVADPPSVLVEDAFGNPVSGVEVTFAVTAGGGTIVPAGPTTVSTDANGVATATSWTLGTSAGTDNNTVTGSASGLTGSPVSFTASAAAGPAANIAANTTTSQSATVNTAVSAPPSVLVTDAFDNPVAGVQVTFAVTAGGGAVDPAGPSTVTTGADGIATATSWTLGTTAGTNNNTVTATKVGLTGSPVSFTASGLAGAATNIAPFAPASGVYPGTPQPFTVANPDPTVAVTDVFGNAVAGQTVVWELGGDDKNGGSISGSGYSVSWTFGDGGNVLNAYLGSTTGPAAGFSATTATGGSMLACDPSGQSRKASVGNYDAAAGTYTAYFSMQPELAARIRSVTLYASVTGQSSSVETYPATLNVYRGATTAADLTSNNLIASSAGGSGLTLPGDNGTAAPAVFTMDPNLDRMVARPNNNKVIFELVVEAASNRTVQLWYNSKATGATCGNSIVYADGITDFNTNGNKDIAKGLQIRITN